MTFKRKSGKSVALAVVVASICGIGIGAYLGLPREFHVLMLLILSFGVILLPHGD